MKRIYFTLLSLSLVFNTFSQSPISIDKIINDLDWGNCNESDVILAFKENIVKKEKEEEFNGNGVSSFSYSPMAASADKTKIPEIVAGIILIAIGIKMFI